MTDIDVNEMIKIRLHSRKFVRKNANYATGLSSTCFYNLSGGTRTETALSIVVVPPKGPRQTKLL